MKYEVGGIGAVNPTPYNPDGSINENEYRRHIRWLVDCGVRFLQPAAATGQSMQTTRDEYRRLLEMTVEEVGSRAFVTAYAGRPDPRETIDLINIAQDVGAHSAFLIQPFFSLPDQEGLYRYYKMVAQNTELPLVFYNNPSRTGINLSIDVMDRITDECPNYVGLKQSDIEQYPASVRRLGSKIKVMPKSEHHILFGLTLGAPGVLTFAASIIPNKVVKILSAWQDGDLETARRTYLEWLPLFDAIHIEPVPNAVHYMLNRMGWCFGQPRVPGHEPSEANKRKLDEILNSLGLLQQDVNSRPRAQVAG
ncbi:dihydrodipicolinate synthase family protein [Crenalkalicoccus roseus]|uniref:dihydrodipicolinate synthase family protein n=1 Tax=Crenalkalicoccus roseus TaxID=1485588 RepID=UPI001305422A|nr:dihydrodipicolinate synthase family protein [Crenalkalicoccus roseus]